MDPYIEAAGIWGDCHGSMIGAMRAELNARLPERYVASIDLFVWLHEPDAKTRTRIKKPDVYLSEKASRHRSRGSGSITTAPVTLVLPAETREGNKYLKILDQNSQRVVTVIELLSATNKLTGPDRDAYMAKRNEYLASRVNLVEIDLLRAGPRMPLSEPPPKIRDYYAMVSRAWEFPRVGFWEFSVRDFLPDVPVPLARNESDVVLPLRKCLDRAYDEGTYWRRSLYDASLNPPLSRSDAAWVRGLLARRSA
jgi:hypothetical protein